MPDLKPQVEPKLRALDEAIAKHLGVSPLMSGGGAGGAGPASAAPAAPAGKAPAKK